MALIIFTQLRTKTFKLFIFIFICMLSFNIPRVFNGFGLFDIDIINSGSQIVISFPFILSKLFQKKPIFENNNKFSKKDIIIFVLVVIIYFIYITINFIYDYTLNYISTLFNTYNVFMVVSTIASKYTSNSGYFVHHLIGQIIFFISASINDIYSYRFREDDLAFDWKHITIATLDWVSECTVLLYKKYLMEYKYMSPYLVSLIIGCCSSIYILFIYFLSYFNHNVICFNDSCFNFFSVNMEEYHNKLHLVSSIIISIIFVIAFYFMNYNIIFDFTICHLLLPFYFQSVIDNIINAINHNVSFGQWIIFILSIIFLLIGVSIYLEIIELNFWNLNANTRRKIESRGKEADLRTTINLGEIIEEEDDEEEDSHKESAFKRIEISPGYIIEL